MEMTNLEYIQSKIGYTFKNPGLLIQAFIRKSYTEENKNALHNEVLEFYGDKALELIIMKKMSKHYGNVVKEIFYASDKDEGSLTEIKKKLVCREMLASKIRELGFHDRLFMGHGDIEQEIWKQESVQEDLFEAILGAVAIDSDWNVDALTKVVEHMLNPEFYFENGFGDELDYVQLIQQWCQTKYHWPPQYDFINDSKLGNSSGGVLCHLSITAFIFFQAWGKNKKNAKTAVAKKAYEYLEAKKLLVSLTDIVGKPDIDKAVNQLQELYQKGYICEPQYSFEEAHDKNGNPVWYCNCYIMNINYPNIPSCHISKKQAKKEAAYRILKFFLGGDNHEA